MTSRGLSARWFALFTNPGMAPWALLCRPFRPADLSPLIHPTVIVWGRMAASAYPWGSKNLANWVVAARPDFP